LDPVVRQANLDFWRQRIQLDQQRDPAAELFEIYQGVLSTPRDSTSETLAQVLVSSMDDAKAQSDLRGAVRSVSKRLLAATRRKVMTRLHRLRLRRRP